ncbi:hypothetical protein F0562_027552 [Nyssa sinensis]|uniref:Uncharacterized protein n=1 Tax=Nyssa sinensis TaxID=561372 RepID=A0A5J5B5E3_9ASTE|nr:hypothetical protein F0562_027552 [Nyssa sinensis]
MTGCAERVNYSSMVGGPGGQLSGLPKSFSVSSSRSNDSEDFRELIRAASTRSLANRVELDMHMQQQMRRSTAVGMGSTEAMPRSCSVGMGRIDEDKACDFGEDDNINVKAELFG